MVLGENCLVVSNSLVIVCFFLLKMLKNVNLRESKFGNGIKVFFYKSKVRKLNYVF